MKVLRSLPILSSALGAVLLLSSCSKAERDTPTPTVSFTEEQRTAARGSYALTADDYAQRYTYPGDWYAEEYLLHHDPVFRQGLRRK